MKPTIKSTFKSTFVRNQNKASYTKSVAKKKRILFAFTHINAYFKLKKG